MNPLILIRTFRAGKMTQAVAAGRALLQAGHWQHAFFADLSGCESRAGVCLSLQAAFGIPGDSADPDLLLTWLRRCDLGLIGLIVKLPGDTSAAAKNQSAIAGPLKSMLQVRRAVLIAWHPSCLNEYVLTSQPVRTTQFYL